MNTLIPVRASSLAELFDCPARWKAKHIDKMTMPTSGAAWLGTSIHRSTAAFDQSVLDDEGLTADDTADILVDAIQNPDEEVEWDEKLQPANAEAIGLALHARYCSEFAPTKQYEGVEVRCDSLEIDFDQHDVTIQLTGTTDRIERTPDGKRAINDLKSGKRAVDSSGVAKTAGHGLQIGVYELLAEHATGEPIDGPAQIIGLQTNGKARIGVGYIEGARDKLIGTEESPGALDYAAQMLGAGLFPGNPRSMLCNPKFCPAYGICRFRD